MRSGVSWAQRIRRKNFKGFMLSSCWGGGVAGGDIGKQSGGSGLEGGEGQKKEGKKNRLVHFGS